MTQVIKGVGDLNLEPEAILQRPELAAMIAAIAARWTRVEGSLAELFVALLPKEASAALAIYLEMFDQNVRKIAFDAIAKERLASDSFEGFQRLFNKIRKKSKERNRFIHGFWVISESHKDGLLLIDQKEWHRADFSYKISKFSSLEHKMDWVRKNMAESELTKYTADDLRETLDRIRRLEDKVFEFRSAARFVR